jgi:hypothetical protein
MMCPACLRVVGGAGRNDGVPTFTVLPVSSVTADHGGRARRTIRVALAISLLRLDGHANIAAANRHHARDAKRTLKLLKTA